MSRLRRKKTSTLKAGSNNSHKRQRTVDLGLRDDEENIDSDDSVNDDDDLSMVEESDISEEETLDAKKLRLAKEYLRKLETGEGSDGSSSSEEDSEEEDRVGLKLQRDRLKQQGTLEYNVAHKVEAGLAELRSTISTTPIQATEEAKSWIQAGHVKLLRGHDLTPTCVALQRDGSQAISGSKDQSVLLWDITKEQRSHTICPHWKKNKDSQVSRTDGEVLSATCSDDGRYAAIGRRDATVSIFDIRVGHNNLVKTFTGHKGPITSLAFRAQSLQLFSASVDRCIRHYNLSEMMYIETLYGHQFGVSDIDCHRKERPISVGRDRTARAWKLAEDTHLIFRGGAKVSSADCVSVVKDDWFVSGHDDGHLGLWMTEKKKAVKSIDFAHGTDGGVGRDICALEALKGSDLALTGSYDGYVRLWKVLTGATLDSRGLEPLEQIPITGYVNSIAIGPKASFCVLATGQEPKLGRWNRIPGAKNRLAIVKLRTEVHDNDDEPAVKTKPSEETGTDNESDSS